MGCSWSPPPQANPPAPPNPTKGQGQCRGLPSIPSPHRRGLSGSGPSPLGLPSRRSSPPELCSPHLPQRAAALPPPLSTEGTRPRPSARPSPAGLLLLLERSRRNHRSPQQPRPLPQSAPAVRETTRPGSRPHSRPRRRLLTCMDAMMDPPPPTAPPARTLTDAAPRARLPPRPRRSRDRRGRACAGRRRCGRAPRLARRAGGFCPWSCCPHRVGGVESRRGLLAASSRPGCSRSTRRVRRLRRDCPAGSRQAAARAGAVGKRRLSGGAATRGCGQRFRLRGLAPNSRRGSSERRAPLRLCRAVLCC